MELLRDKIKRDTFMCSKVCAMVSRGELRENHPQQRTSGQWDNGTRDIFIVTVIKNEDFDPIKICEQLTDEGVVLWLIDGLQRSTTIANFKAGKFKLGRNIDPQTIEYQEAVKNESGEISYQNVSYDLRGKAYKDLPDKLKEEFDNCPVYVVKHLDCTDEEVGRHIVRYNSGRPMVVAQKIAAYMHNTAKYVKRISKHAFFNDCANYSETKDKNGDIDKVVSEAVMGLNFFDSWNKNAQKIGKHLNDNATEEMFDNFNNYLDRLLKVITPITGQLFTTKNALIWFMLFDRFVKSGLSDDKFQLFLENYDEFKKVKVEVEHNYELIKGSGEYTNVLSFAELDGCKSTKDKGIILDKLHILETAMNEFLHIKDSDVEEINNEVTKDKIKEDSVEVFISEITDIDVETLRKDIDWYISMLEDENGLKDRCIRDDSRLLNRDNSLSLLAMVAYAESKEENLDEWLTEYASNNDEYLFDQKENYLHMKKSFDAYLQKGVMA